MFQKKNYQYLKVVCSLTVEKYITKKVIYKLIKYIFSFVIAMLFPLFIVVISFVILISSLNQNNSIQPPIDNIIGDGQLSYPVPTHTNISSVFGVRKDPFTGVLARHNGIDFPAPFGTTVVSSEKGIVEYSDYNMGGYGYLVIIKHNENMVTYYAHNSRILVQKGEQVEKGTPIAEVGSTGNSTGNHLHFEVRIDNKPVDPTFYLTNENENNNESEEELIEMKN